MEVRPPSEEWTVRNGPECPHCARPMRSTIGLSIQGGEEVCVSFQVAKDIANAIHRVLQETGDR